MHLQLHSLADSRRLSNPCAKLASLLAASVIPAALSRRRRLIGLMTLSGEYAGGRGGWRLARSLADPMHCFCAIRGPASGTLTPSSRRAWVDTHRCAIARCRSTWLDYSYGGVAVEQSPAQMPRIAKNRLSNRQYRAGDSKSLLDRASVSRLNLVHLSCSIRAW